MTLKATFEHASPSTKLSLHAYKKEIKRSTNYKGTHPLCLVLQDIQGNNIACRFDSFVKWARKRMFQKSCHTTADLYQHAAKNVH